MRMLDGVRRMNAHKILFPGTRRKMDQRVVAQTGPESHDESGSDDIFG